MIYELNHVGLKTADIEASIGFYVNVLGGKIVRDAKSTDGKARFVYVQLEKGIIELITSDSIQDQGFIHIAYIVDDYGLDASYELLKNQGREFTRTPRVAGSGDGRLAFFIDPCGVTIELIERKPVPREELPYNPNLVKFEYTAIGAGDAQEETAKFYHEVMEMTEGDGNLCTLKGESVKIKGQENGILYISMKCENAQQLREKLRSCGICTIDHENGFIAVAPSSEFILFHE